MNKKTFRQRWYYRLLQVLFFVSLPLAMYPGIWAILYEDDMPFMGVVWIGIVLLIYWLVKRIFYHVMFGDNIVPGKNSR